MKMLSRPFSILLPATPLVLAACIMLGSGGIGFPDISTEAGWNIFLLRLNRIITAFVVGAALSAAGTVFQAVLRNALAEPYVLGVSSGAALGSAIAILTGINAFSIFVMPSIAFTMAALTLFIVFSLASGRSASPSVYGLILSGVIVSSVCSSLLMFLISVAPSRGLHNIMWWMLGNLEPSSIKLLAWSSAIILVAFLGAWALAPELNALTLGREAAHFLGIRTDFAMIASLVMATLLTAAAVGLAGLIGFVGLVVPHAVRNITGPDHRRLLPAAALAGGVFLAICDAAARIVLRPVELPVGVITALVGGPFFLIILRKRRHNGWMS